MGSAPSGAAPFRLVRDREHYELLVVEGILTARFSVAIATANLKDVQVERNGRYGSIVERFEELVERGVEVRVLHGRAPSDFYLERLKLTALSRHPRFGMRLCPRVHLKTVLIDARRAYIGSANLTGAGLGAKSAERRNFELGVLTDDPRIVEEVGALFDGIWEGEGCPDCDRRSFCPTPLEEPDF